MPYIYLIAAVSLISILSLLATGYNKKNAEEKNIAPLYNFILSASACVTWGVIYVFDFSFDAKALLYSLGFGICYAVVMMTLIKALSCGPTSLTALMQQLSLIGVTLWGFVFWKTWDNAKAPLILTGLTLVVVSSALSLYTGKRVDGKISLKWIGYVAISFLANAGCSIFQRSEQMAFDGKHGSMFMFFGMLLSTLLCFVLFMIGKKPNVGKVLQSSWGFPVCAGVGNASGNLFVVLLVTTHLSPNLIYPTIAVGGLAITSFVSMFLFKEKLAWWQWIGIAVGAIAVTLLSIG